MKKLFAALAALFALALAAPVAHAAAQRDEARVVVVQGAQLTDVAWRRHYRRHYYRRHYRR